MRILLAALHRAGEPAPGERPEECGASSAARAARLEEAHVLALAVAMRDGGRLAPLLVCRRKTSLHDRAVELGLPLLALGGPGTAVALARLWLWQRRHRALLVQTVGEEAMSLGRRILRLRPAGTTLLSHAFLLAPPRAAALKGLALRAAHKILCGSGHVRERIAGALHNGGGSAMGATRALPLAGELLESVSPGMDLTGYTASPEWTAEADAAGRHFIFCMHDALMPRSGALLTVRAMAAIRQREDLPMWEVRAFGAGPRFGEVLHEARTLGVASRLCLLGEQPLPQALPHAHVWLAPGTSPEELPETLWAGAAAGLPTPCSESPLHRERLAGAPDAACVFAAEDPQALALAMIHVMSDAGLRRRLAAGGQALRPHLGYAAFTERTLALYTDWCGQWGRLGRDPASDAGGEGEPLGAAPVCNDGNAGD